MADKYAITVAGGKGLRLGADRPKQFLPLGGLPMAAHSLYAFKAYSADVRQILVLPSNMAGLWEDLRLAYKIDIPLQVVQGGEERYHSVKNALDIIPSGSEGLVAIHDAARPLLSVPLISLMFDAAAQHGGAVPAIPLKDSLRHNIEKEWQAVDRSMYRIVQTPQVFDLEKLKRAYSLAYKKAFTDDASVFEAAGNKVWLAEGDERNIKITTATDMALATIMMDK